MWIDVFFLMFLVLGVHQALWISRFTASIVFGTFLAINFSNILAPSPSKIPTKCTLDNCLSP